MRAAPQNLPYTFPFGVFLSNPIISENKTPDAVGSLSTNSKIHDAAFHIGANVNCFWSRNKIAEARKL